MSEGTGGAMFVAGAVRVGRVFDDNQLAVAGDGHDGVHRSRLAGKVHGNDRPGARGDGSLDSLWIQVKGVEVNVGEYRDGVGFNDGGGCRKEGIRRNNDFIFSADT